MELEKILKIINQWDPVDLIILHSPNTEYISEAQEIKKIYDAGNRDILFIGKTIYDIFIYYFGEENFKEDLSNCIDIARKILED